MNKPINHRAYGNVAMVLPLAAVAIVTIAENKPVFAQLTPDNTLGAESSIVTPQQLRNLIQGGAIRGNALFHSFDEFNVGDGRGVFFDLQNNTDILNIFTRVTGSSSSSILGTLGVLNDALNSNALGNANLFLLNPNGITFGANANLQLNGSFFATTADGLDFDDFSFSASGEEAPPPLLTISIPRFLSFRDNPGDIAVNQSNLIVNEEQNLSLVGGNVTVAGSGDVNTRTLNLNAPDGRIEVGSVGSSGSVSLTQTDAGFVLGYEGIENFGDITFNQFAYVDTSGENGGSIQLQGRDITLSDRTLIFADTRGVGTGGGIVVNSEQLLIEGGSFLTADVTSVPSSSGQGGNITINTTGSVQVIGTSANGRSRSTLAARANRNSTGDAGDLTINTSQLLIQGGARISTDTSGEGDGGNLTVNAADSVQVTGTADNGAPSLLTAQANSNATGDAGDLTINTSQLLIQGGARVSANNSGEGNGGNITVNATDSVQVIGRSADGEFASLLTAQARSNSTGDAGDLTITTSQLLIQGGARVRTDTFAGGDAGNLTVNATDSVQVIGRLSSLAAGARTNSTGGDAGDLTITTSQLLVQDSGQIGASTFADGDGGNLTIQAEAIELAGFTSSARSGLFASAINGDGNGGNIDIETDQLIVRDGAIISVSNFQSQGTREPGRGNVGNINITSETITLDDGRITASGNTAIGGNISLNISDYILLLNGNGTLDENSSLALISANSQGEGGNITIDTSILMAIPGQDSDITADSTGTQGASGGRVIVDADGVFGIQASTEDLTDRNDITARSQSGSRGTIILSTPETEINQETLNLPEEVVDSSDIVTQSVCSDFGGNNQLANTGRGGIPPIPGLVTRNDVVNVDLVDEVLPAPPAEAIKPHHRTTVTYLNSEGEETKPAMGAVLLPNGMVEFVDYNPAEVYRDMYAAAGCSSNKE